MTDAAHSATPAIDNEALKKAEAYVEQEEGSANHLAGTLGGFLTAMAVLMSVFHL